MSAKFFTNRDSNTLFNKFAGVFTYNKNINNFDVLVGYFRSSGYFKIRPFLENIANIRILVGINVDKITADMQQQGLALFKGDDDQTFKHWQQQFIEDAQNARYDQQTEQGILQFTDDMRQQKLELKAHPSKKIHAKIYIFRPDNFNEHNSGSIITGSSNLTSAGLGIQTASNYEFNVLLNDYTDVKFASDEFEKLWAEGVSILPEQAIATKDKTYLSDNITPYELYLKCLIEYFGSEIEFDPNSIKDLPKDFKHLSYQMDAVNQGFEMLKKHNGFFLSDVVGLGKTIIAILIARQFLFLGGRGHNPSILLIVPPALKQNWRDTLEKFDISGKVTILTNGSLHKITRPQKYDMVIVDEAHKFRNDTAVSYGMLQRICKTPNKANKAKKVILISATPLNNKPNDLYNQILLFQDGNNSTLDFPLAPFFTKTIKEHKAILRLTNQQNIAKRTKQLYQQIRQQVITPLMVRRTRTDLMDNKRYKKDLEEHNVVFPKTAPLKIIYYKLEPTLEKLYDNTINQIDNKNQSRKGLLYTRYRALGYLSPKFKEQYTRADIISEQLVGIMKTLLLKRMDSSFYAFRETLTRFITSSQVMLKMIDNDEIIIAPNLNIEDYILEDREEELMSLLARESLTDPTIIICRRDDFEKGFIEGVKHDHQILLALKASWDEVTIDPKRDEFLDQLPIFLDLRQNPEGKIIIFTESRDTMQYLEKVIAATDYKNKTLAVSSTNIRSLKQTINRNFDANIESTARENDYQIIITTDVLAEGVNLHRANSVINYDTPWNSTKLMQRIGRVNRIGQASRSIFVYNFYPTAQIDDDIQLKKRAFVKLQAFHSALGGDEQIYSIDEQISSFGIFDENIQQQKDEILPFLEEVRAFREKDPDAYKRLRDLPSKVRNAVKSPDYKNSTLIFTRNEDKGSRRFYRVGGEGDKIANYSFLEAATLLKQSINSEQTPLPKCHYSQVSSALQHFEDELVQTIMSRSQNKLLSPMENKAINFLKALKNLSNDDEQQQIAQAISQIEDKRFSSLVKDINKLSKNIQNIKPTVILEKALIIIKKYNIDNNPNDEGDKVRPISTKPTIIISQSYT